jgi:hypothetical protein
MFSWSNPAKGGTSGLGTASKQWTRMRFLESEGGKPLKENL